MGRYPPVVRQAPDLEPGWKWLYTRGYTIGAPSIYARRWMVEYARTRSLQPPVTGPARKFLGRGRFPYKGGRRSGSDLHRVSTWRSIPPDGVTVRDSVYRDGRLQIIGEDRYRLIGGEAGGCIVEVIALRKPVSPSSRFGFLLLPRWSVRTIMEESRIFEELDHDYLRGR